MTHFRPPSSALVSFDDSSKLLSLASASWILLAQSDPGHLCFPSTTLSPLTALHGLVSPSGMSFHVVLVIFSSLLKCCSDSSPQQR